MLGECKISYFQYASRNKRETINTDQLMYISVTCIAIIVTVYFYKSSENVFFKKRIARQFTPIHLHPNDINALFLFVEKIETIIIVIKSLIKTCGKYHESLISFHKWHFPWIRHSKPPFASVVNDFCSEQQRNVCHEHGNNRFLFFKQTRFTTYL